MKRFLIVGGLIIASTLAPVKAMAATFSQLVVYGDSLSDVGKAFAATSTSPTPAPPYGSLTGGRFSNGPVWVEYLAARLGIPATNNFAVGGATTGIPNTLSPFYPIATNPNANGLIGVQQQIANTPTIADPSALYIVWAGANDYLGGLPIDPLNPTLQPLTNLANDITALIGRGATNILVPNLPNLGELPSTRTTPNALNLNLLTQLHNAGLAAGIDSLSLANPTVKLNLLDVNSLFDQAVRNPSSFGFNNVTTQCITVTTLCANPDTNLFWDDIHPTTAAHQLIGNLAFNTVSPTAVPEPLTVVGSLMAFGSAIAFKRKLKSADVTTKELVESN
jgi:thermolabile hemolysin